MSKKFFTVTDISIACGLISLIVFSHVVFMGRPSRAFPLRPLLLQGNGAMYELQVNEQATELEYNARNTLLMLGTAQLAYAGSTSSGRFAEFDQLLKAGYLQPNQTGSTLASGYSISFYLPSGRKGFTLIAEPQDLSLRSFLLSENQQVILLTPSVQTDPNDSWETVRAMESELLYTTGRFDYLNGLQLLNYDPPLQVRLNAEMTNYVLTSFKINDRGTFETDDSLIYSSSLRSYMIGDVRDFE